VNAGNQYFISCDVEIIYGPGELLTQLSEPSFLSCIDACDALSRVKNLACLGAAYTWATGICKLSTAGQNAVRSSSVGTWFASGSYQK
jgi:hypothetical protein